MIASGQRLSTIFGQALDIESPADRATFVDRACECDTDLRAGVERLLQAHERAGRFLDPAGVLPPSAASLLSPLETPGTVIGPYKLVEQIGEGGMGLVFMAEQSQPVRRCVALKVLKPGLDTRHVLARFEAERQALAMMDHPHIAKVFDAGTTPAGRPYFVMELVRGVPITEFCDQRRFDPRRRLELFVEVCRAVQHAHQKGVIHRDLKPSNVLVTLHDTVAVPKVIDFGIAKATGERLTERTLVTHFAQMVGTPLYMSPEQAEMNGLDVDTRSDVYALGVLLYELLTGATPFGRERLKSAGCDEVRRILREEEPPRPSRQVATLGAAEVATVAEQRGVDARQFGQLLRGDLDWVVMKALEKDRNRRYESASAFAQDVERYLAAEAVEARPPSATYRLRKFAGRNRATLVAAGFVAATLVAATAVSTWQAVKAWDAERRAADEAAIARAVNEFFQEVVLLQVTAAPDSEDEIGGSRDITVREALLREAARIDHAFKRQPLVEAAIRTTIGQGLNNVEEGKLAIAHLERGVSLRQIHCGADHPDTLTSMHNLANSYARAGRFSEELDLCRHVWESRKAVLGSDHPETLRSMRDLANAYGFSGQWDLCNQLREQVFEKTRVILGPTHLVTLGAMSELAVTLRHMGRAHEAVALHEKVLELHKSTNVKPHDKDSFYLIQFAVSCQEAGKLDQAERLLHEKLEVDRHRNDSIGRLRRASALGWLARTRLLQQRYTEGESNVREVLAVFEQQRPNDARRFYWMNILGGLLGGQGKHAEAESNLVQGFQGMKEAGVTLDSDWKLRDAGERVVRFFEATNQPEKAIAWRAMLSP